MATRPTGRPKSTNPRDVRVTVRLTDHEADLLQRLAQDKTLSETVRTCVVAYIATHYRGETNLRDTPEAHVRRELRKARRAASPDAEALLDNFILDEAPATDGPPRPPAQTPREKITRARASVAALSAAVVPTPAQQVTIMATKLPPR